MSKRPNPLLETLEVNKKVGAIFKHRISNAQSRFKDSMKAALAKAPATEPAELSASASDYMTDLAQRSILFWDTMRERGNQFLAHHRAGLPPVLHFEYEMVLDARTFKQPVNYALLRITPPKGVTIDMTHRPYIIIDPRAGHGPGIGGFKEDSQVGVALRAGHPVYFVTFFQHPEPGQTLLDVCDVESVFLRKVREWHPDSPKPAIIGNCQGGWAAMMLAASDPENTGPIVINGAPMSFWGGAWEDGDNDNPMRYSGGLLGGTWLSSMVADMSNGVFDGAWLVKNFEGLNPANTFWNKYYHLFANIDTEPERFLEFERWWGGMYLMNREEIEWITQNLFVGNRLWAGDVQSKSGRSLDLREIRSPIILFASMGDNITPPEQAFNWVADVYNSTEDIKASGQVIVGLLHKDVGHLGIFVSGRVATKEHTQIVSVLNSIEALPPGLYQMDISTTTGEQGEEVYEVEFSERRLEEVAAGLNKFERKDEKPFEAAAAVSAFNQKAYETLVQPLVQAMASDASAKLQRDFHSLRVQRWAVSELNPFLNWLPEAAKDVRAQRKGLAKNHPWRQWENIGSAMINASLDYFRDISNAKSEAAFFSLYGNMPVPDHVAGNAHLAEKSTVEPRQLPAVQAALAQIEKGGFAEAAARIGFLLQRQGEPMPLSRLEMRADVAKDYDHLLPDCEPIEWRRIRGVQEIIVRFEPEKSIKALAKLLSVPSDRQKMTELLDAILGDVRIQHAGTTAAQFRDAQRIRAVLQEMSANGAASLVAPSAAPVAQAKAKTVAKAKPTVVKAAPVPKARPAAKPASAKPAPVKTAKAAVASKTTPKATTPRVPRSVVKSDSKVKH